MKDKGPSGHLILANSPVLLWNKPVVVAHGMSGSPVYIMVSSLALLPMDGGLQTASIGMITPIEDNGKTMEYSI